MCYKYNLIIIMLEASIVETQESEYWNIRVTNEKSPEKNKRVKYTGLEPVNFNVLVS